MPLLTAQQYIVNREAYAYSDQQVAFHVHQTGNLPYHGDFQGIFPRTVPATHPNGVNLRKFESICQSVFNSAGVADAQNAWTPDHIANIQAVTFAIVHWKMASQGGRANINVNNVGAQWNAQTHLALLRAYQHQSLCEFKIGGVRIPTASAFLRFLYPDQFGIVDTRVVNNHTQPAGVTTMRVRADGYINDVRQNDISYLVEYVPFLLAEAQFLNGEGAQFNDVNEHDEQVFYGFRACDIEMALF